MNDPAAFQKRRVLLELLDKGMVMLHLDPRGEDVIVPSHLKGEPSLRLNIAYGFRLPALDIGAEGVYAVLSFNRQNFGCTIPWRAIYGMTLPDDNHLGKIWQESVPTELLEGRPTPRPKPALVTASEAEAAPSASVEASEATPAPSPKAGFKLRAIESPSEEAPSAELANPEETQAPAAEPKAAPEAAPEAPKKRAHLTLVKR